MNRYKNDIAWEQIFEKHRILDAIKSKGRVTISSTDINEFREARLMTKFDHRSQLPHLLHDFTGEDNLFPTISGRMSSSLFDFKINSSEDQKQFEVKVNNSQIEIDGGYEGNDSLILIEAKN